MIPWMTQPITAPPALPPPPPRRWLLAIVVLSLIPVGLGLWFGRCTQDDAFISFRYAQNFIEGHGLVFNPLFEHAGTRVEGFTNLLWTLLIATAMAAGLDPVPTSMALGTLSAAGAVALTAALGLRSVGRWSTHERAPWVLLLTAPALVATLPHMALESVEGLETALYMALITAAAMAALDEQRAARGHAGSTTLLAIATLTRPEAPLLFGLLHLGLLIGGDRRQRAASVRAGLGMAAVLATLTAWRLWYYGLPLPNTFYAKTGGFAVPRGLRYLGRHALSAPLLWLLLLARPLAGRAGPFTLPLALMVGGHLAYVAWVGGDFKPTGRFVMPVLPLMAVLAQETLIHRSGAHRSSADERPPLPSAARVVAWLGGAILLIAPLRRTLPESLEWAEERHANLMSRREVGEFLRERLPPDTLIAIHSAGVVPYYAELPTLDMWGLTDAHIARAPVPDLGQGMAGHERRDWDYVLSRDPAMFLPEDRMFTWSMYQQKPKRGMPDGFVERYTPVSIPLKGRYLNVWLRKGFLRSIQRPTSREER